MSDDIETLRAFINGSGWAREYKEKMIVIMERIAEHVADRDRLQGRVTTLQKMIDDRHSADKKAWRVIMNATGRTRGLPPNKEIIAYYMAEVERLEKELKRSEDDNAANFEAAQAECGGRIVAEIEVDSLRAKLERAKEALRGLHDEIIPHWQRDNGITDGSLEATGPLSEPTISVWLERARAVLSELSDDAPAQPTRRMMIHDGSEWFDEASFQGGPAQQTQISNEVREALVEAEADFEMFREAFVIGCGDRSPFCKQSLAKYESAHAKLSSVMK